MNLTPEIMEEAMRLFDRIPKTETRTIFAGKTLLEEIEKTSVPRTGQTFSGHYGEIKITPTPWLPRQMENGKVLHGYIMGSDFKPVLITS